MKYEYKFIEVPLRENGYKTQVGDGFNKCREIIIKEASEGWRLNQIVIPVNEKSGVSLPYCYQIILEKALEE